MNRYQREQRRLRTEARIKKNKLAMGEGEPAPARKKKRPFSLGQGGSAGQVTPSAPPTQRGEGLPPHAKPMGIYGRLRLLAEELLHHVEGPIVTVVGPVVVPDVVPEKPSGFDFERFKAEAVAERMAMDPDERADQDAMKFADCLHNAVENMGERLDVATARLSKSYPWQAEAYNALMNEDKSHLFLLAVAALQEDEGLDYPQAMAEAEKRFPVAAMDYASGGRVWADELARQKVGQ